MELVTSLARTNRSRTLREIEGKGNFKSWLIHEKQCSEISEEKKISKLHDWPSRKRGGDGVCFPKRGKQQKIVGRLLSSGRRRWTSAKGKLRKFEQKKRRRSKRIPGGEMPWKGKMGSSTERPGTLQDRRGRKTGLRGGKEDNEGRNHEGTNSGPPKRIISSRRKMYFLWGLGTEKKIERNSSIEQEGVDPSGYILMVITKGQTCGYHVTKCHEVGWQQRTEERSTGKSRKKKGGDEAIGRRCNRDEKLRGARHKEAVKRNINQGAPRLRTHMRNGNSKARQQSIKVDTDGKRGSTN